MTRPQPTITVNVDLTNPGQFFACCGLLELADRLWPEAEGWFEGNCFHINCAGTLQSLFEVISTTQLEQLDMDDDMASPMQLGFPISMRLNWWKDEISNGKKLKVWAGSMRAVRIAKAMQKAIADAPITPFLFDFATVAHDTDQPKKKVEPYYFDCRRGCNARSLDIGFATDSLKINTLAYPVVEFLCLIGLQRARPSPTNKRRVFDYHAWETPLPPVLAALVACGELAPLTSSSFRFENAFRTDQKKHKSFLPAIPIGDNP